MTRELKAELEKIFVDNQSFQNMIITVLSFGFKYGIPEDADLVFDVRFLPNPYYIEEAFKSPSLLVMVRLARALNVEITELYRVRW